MYSRSRLTSYQSKKFIERKKNRAISIAVLSVICLTLWVYCISSFSYLNIFSIKDVKVEGADQKFVESLKSLVLNSLNGDYFGIFSKSNVFIYPHDQITASIIKALPSVKSLSIKRDGFQGLKINIIQKKPSAIICASLPDFSEDSLLLDEASNCYYADSSGYIFDEADLSTTSLNFESIANLNRYYIPILAEIATSSSSIVGLYATSSTEFVNLQVFYDGVRKVNLKPLAILAKDGGEYEMYIGNAIVYFNNSRPFKDQLLNFISFWDHFNSQKNEDIDSFESIDIRYGSNVFYRKIK